MSSVKPAPESEAVVDEARFLSRLLFNGLSIELKSAMQKDGPVAAIDVCNIRAPAIQAELEQIYPGWSVGRTSLKTRNPGNIPSEAERSVLLEFEKRKSAGEDIGLLEDVKVQKVDGGFKIHYMKAIPFQQLCSKCHGPPSSLDPAVASKIRETYPDDMATGYKPGDLRGAFTIISPVQPTTANNNAHQAGSGCVLQ